MSLIESDTHDKIPCMLFELIERFIDLDEAEEVYMAFAEEDVIAFEHQNSELVMSLISSRTVEELSIDFETLIKNHDLSTRVLYLILPVIWIRNTRNIAPSILCISFSNSLAKTCYDIWSASNLMMKCWNYKWPREYVNIYLSSKEI